MKYFYILFFFIATLYTLDEPEGLKLSDIYKIKQQMQQYLKQNTMVEDSVRDRKLLQKNNYSNSQMGIQQDRYLEPIALSNRQKRKLLQNFDKNNAKNNLRNNKQNNKVDLSKKI